MCKEMNRKAHQIPLAGVKRKKIAQIGCRVDSKFLSELLNFGIKEVDKCQISNVEG